MALKVTLPIKTPTEIMEIVRELRAGGCVQGKDFDFAYHKPEWSEIGDQDRYTIFTFYTEKWATWFTLRYT